MRSSRLLVVALVVSIAINVKLAMRSSTGSTVAPAVEHVHDSTSSVRARARISQPVIETATNGALLDSCNAQLIAARGQLAAAQEELAQRIQQRVRFEEGEPAPAMEQRVRPLVETAISRLPGIVHHEVECRGLVCKVRVSAGTREEASRGWGALTQDPALRGLIDIFTSEAGEPVVDLASGKGGFDIDFYLNTRSAADATSEIQSLVDGFLSSGTIVRCAPSSLDRGVLEVKVSVLPDEARLAAAIGGTLAGTALGTCVSEAFAAELAAFEVPPGTKYGTVYATFVSPHGT